MTAPRDFRDFLRDMVLACRSMMRFVDGMSLEAHLADEKTRYAVMRGFEILGDAVRNRIVHGYFGIDDTILFTTIERDIGPLLPRLEALADAHGVRP